MLLYNVCDRATREIQEKKATKGYEVKQYIRSDLNQVIFVEKQK